MTEEQKERNRLQSRQDYARNRNARLAAMRARHARVGRPKRLKPPPTPSEELALLIESQARDMKHRWYQRPQAFGKDRIATWPLDPIAERDSDHASDPWEDPTFDAVWNLLIQGQCTSMADNEPAVTGDNEHTYRGFVRPYWQLDEHQHFASDDWMAARLEEMAARERAKP